MKHFQIGCNNYTTDYFENLGLIPDEWRNVNIYEPMGCNKCLNTGFQGRMAIHEALQVNKEIKKLIYNAGEEINEEAMKAIAKKNGTLSLRESGFEKVRLGLTSFSEVITNTMDD